MNREKSAGGRPQDEVWKHVERLEHGKWKCKYCGREYAGSASRIKNHLSGLENDISLCKNVPREIREEVSGPKPNKKRRSSEEDNEVGNNVRGQDMVRNTISRGVASDSITIPLQVASGSGRVAPLQVQDPPPSSSNDLVSIRKTIGAEEYVTDALLKFLMCNKFSSVGPDILKDPYLREYMERAQKYGVPSSFLLGGSLVVEKSLFNIKQEVRQYMLMVKESWDITGCTLMAFHLNHGYKGKVFTLGQDMYVYGFYCPKGFIFVEAPDCSIDDTAFYNALRQHSPSLSVDDAGGTTFLHHSINHSSGDDHLCELSDKKPRADDMSNLPCLRYEIQGLCIDTCRRSEWAQRLINRAAEIHEHLSRVEHISRVPLSLHDWYIKLIMGKDEDFKNIEYIGGQDASRVPNFLSNFISFMVLEHKLKEKLSYKTRFEKYVPDRTYLEAILDDSKFWNDGRDLLQVLIMTLRISYVMDTIVPTAGYLEAAIDHVNDKLIDNIDRIREGVEGITFWKDLESKLRGTIKGRRAAASYLNPCYFVYLGVQKQTELLDKLKLEFNTFGNGFSDLRGKEEKLNEELQLYGNIRNKQYEDYLFDEEDGLHPVKWWKEYGNDLPLLREQAIRLLSQPLNCMCNQVKKHIYQLQGADDFILRLNVRMMEEFKRLGDHIYKPIYLFKRLVDLELDSTLSILKKN